MSELESLMRDIRWLQTKRPLGWKAKVRKLVRRCHRLLQV